MKKVIDCIYENRGLEKSALICGEKKLTYAQLWEKSLVMSKRLEKFSCERIALHFANSLEYVISYFAILLSGKTVIPIGYSLGEAEVAEIVRNTGATVIMTDKELDMEGIERVSCMEEETAAIPSFNRADFQGEEVAVIFPTSGTTSESKYVQLTNENLIQNVEAILKIHCMSREKNKNDNELVVLPLTSSFTNTMQLILCLHCSMTISILEGRISVPNIFHTMERDSISFCEMTPTLLKLFAVYYEKQPKDKIVLKRVACGGETINEEELRKVREAMPGIDVYFGYGLTEAGPVVATQSAVDFLSAGNSVGKLLDGFQIRFQRAEGDTDSPDGIGEIQIKGPSIMKGYLNEKVPSVVDGWFATGDIGYMNEDGNLVILGRKKNIIITGGRNINVEEVESVLRKHELIDDAKVYGVKSDLYGEIVAADLILKEGAFIDKKDVIAYCKQYLAEYKIPKQINLVETIKRNSVGKIIRY